MAEERVPDDDGSIRWRVVNGRIRPFEDLFHRLMLASWTQVIVVALFAYLLSALGFALLYMAETDGISNNDGSFAQAYWFSVQTLSTIGYGTMSPVSTYANVLVTIESFVGLAGVAVVTALLYAKFAKPSARVLFSDSVAVHDRDGVPTMHVRMVNERDTPILDVHLHVAVMVDETNQHGHRFRRLYDIKLLRRRIPMFALGFTIMHEIDKDSPFTRFDTDDIAFMIVTFHGTDDALMQPVFGRKLFRPRHVRMGHRFADIVSTSDDGVITLDMATVHMTVPHQLTMPEEETT